MFRIPTEVDWLLIAVTIAALAAVFGVWRFFLRREVTRVDPGDALRGP
jgi:hypothetical protein